MIPEEKLIRWLADSDREPETIRKAWKELSDSGHDIDPIKYGAIIAKRTGSKWRAWKATLLHYRIANGKDAKFEMTWLVKISASRDVITQGKTQAYTPREALRNVLFRNAKDERQRRYAQLNYEHLAKNVTKHVTPVFN